MNPLAKLSEGAPGHFFTRAEGMYLYDDTGKKYMDLISGIAVNNLGHKNPLVLQAITNQLNSHLHLMVYGEYEQKVQIEFAKKITELLPEKLNTVYPVNSGSEAVEGAIKLARRFTSRQEVISFHGAYHGSTFGALSLMGVDTFKGPFEPVLPGIKFMEFNNQNQINLITDQTACVIIEPVQGEAGYIPANKLFLQQVYDRCQEMGALLVFDEVQTGMGRTGSLFAFEHYGIVPDILILAKALGGGMPLGAFIADKEIMDSFQTNPHLGHITTFGGHPLSCAAATANIEALVTSNLIHEVEEKEKLFKKLLHHIKIKEIRGIGLMIAIDLGKPELAQKVIDICFNNGLVTDWFLFSEQSLRIAPPLIITPEEIKIACNILLRAIDEAEKND